MVAEEISKEQKELSDSFRKIENLRGLFSLCSIVIFVVYSFVDLFSFFGGNNNQFDICYFITAITPLVLFSIIAELLFLIPKTRWERRSKIDKVIPKNRDYSEIATKLLHPSTTGYKINRVIRLILIVISVLSLIANIILIFIGVFMFRTS